MGRKLTEFQCLEKFIKIHGNRYDYSKFKYTNSSDKSEFICRIHGSFFQIPNSHSCGHGCPKCNKGIKYDQEFVIRQFQEKHGDLYNYSYVVYKTNGEKIDVECKKHGLFLITPNHHLSGQGCPKCAWGKMGNRYQSNYESFCKEGNIKHNNRYDYSKFVYKTAIIQGEIICPNHGIFLMTPNHHLTGRGCPKCHLSKGELAIENFLKNKNLEYESQKKFESCKNPKTNCQLRYDFYIPSKNLLIEYDGMQHFRIIRFGTHRNTQEEFENLKYKDEVKTEYAKSNNIKLLRINYKQFRKINEILEEEIV